MVAQQVEELELFVQHRERSGQLYCLWFLGRGRRTSPQVQQRLLTIVLDQTQRLLSSLSGCTLIHCFVCPARER